MRCTFLSYIFEICILGHLSAVEFMDSFQLSDVQEVIQLLLSAGFED